MSSAAAMISRFSPSANAALWIRRALALILTIMAVILVVRLVIALLAPKSLWEPVQTVSAPAVQAATARDYDFSNNPFVGGGREAEVAEIVIDPGTDAPETTLNLELKGLRAGSNGSAFIRTPDGNEDNFYIDDEVMSGVILRGVFPDYILLDVNGQRQRLTTEEAKAARAGANQAARAQSLSTLRTVDASDFLSKVQIIPQLNRQMERVGVSVKPRSAGVDLSDFGLQDGDIITSLAGVSLTSGFPDMADLRRRIRPGQPVRLTLLREGQPMTLTIGAPS